MHPFSQRFRRLVFLAKIALLAIPLLAAGAMLRYYYAWTQVLTVLAVIAVLPCFIYGYVLTILHWKSRYRGDHSDFWGVVLFVETSGWTKIIYFFRHILPDMRSSGRYREQASIPGPSL